MTRSSTTTNLRVSSAGQSGGITANKVVNNVVLSPKDPSWQTTATILSTLAGIVGAIAAVISVHLGYLQLPPGHDTKRTPEASSSVPLIQGAPSVTKRALTSTPLPLTSSHNTGGSNREVLPKSFKGSLATESDPVKQSLPTTAASSKSANKLAFAPVFADSPKATATPRPHWAFGVDGGDQRLTEVITDEVSDDLRNPILDALHASLHSEADFSPFRLIDVVRVSVKETDLLPGCALAEVATLEYRTQDAGVASPGSSVQSIDGRMVCIGADRKEATVGAVESATAELRQRIRE